MFPKEEFFGEKNINDYINIFNKYCAIIKDDNILYEKIDFIEEFGVWD